MEQDDTTLDETQIKCLLQYIESSNVPHHSVNLKSICDKNHTMFGGRDSKNPLRRAFQFKWNHQLDKSYVNRKKYWDQHEVPFNAANQSIYEQELETGFIQSERARRRATRHQGKTSSQGTTSSTPKASNMSENLSSPPPKCIDKPVADEVTSVTSGLSSLNVGNNNNDVGLAPVYNINNSAKGGGFMKSLFGKSPARQFGSPSMASIGSVGSPPRMSMSVAVTGFSYDNPLSYPRGEASLLQPQVIPADIHFPERNYPFMLHRVAKMLLNDYAAEGYHLSLNVKPNDVMKYTAYMATVNGQPNRGVLLLPNWRRIKLYKDWIVAVHSLHTLTILH